MPGFILPILTYLMHLSTQPNWTQEHFLTGFAFDEMGVKYYADFDQKLQRLLGPHKNVLVVKIRGLVKEWSFPLFTAFDFLMDQKTFLDIIARLYQINFVVHYTVCDMSTKNTALISKKNFDISPRKPYLIHPENENLNVYFSFDIIHCLKNLTNHVRDDYFKIQDGTIFDVSDFQAVIDKRGLQEISIGYYLSHY